jgi:intracellular sulfur oxidation DsrE/DsrF family protein
MTRKKTTPRRNFLNTLFGGAAAFGIVSLAAPFKAEAAELNSKEIVPAEQLFKNMKGKHKIVFDTTGFRSGAALVWAETFLNTNNETGSPDADLNAVIILRSMAIGMSLNDQMWEKYKLGELYKIDDPSTKSAAVKNQFSNVKTEGLLEPGMSIDVLQKRGVLVCVCSKALQGNSEHIAEKQNLKAEDVHKDLLANILPDIHLVPSGIWALGRAQERGCAYSFAG